PSTTRVLNWNSSTSLATLPVLIWFSELKRVPCTVPAGVVHSLPAAACAHALPPGISAAQSNRAVDRTQWLFIWCLPQRSQLALQQLGPASAPVNPAEHLIQKVHLLVRYRPSVQSVGCRNRSKPRSCKFKLRPILRCYTIPNRQGDQGDRPSALARTEPGRRRPRRVRSMSDGKATCVHAAASSWGKSSA